MDGYHFNHICAWKKKKDDTGQFFTRERELREKPWGILKREEEGDEVESLKREKERNMI